MGKRKSHNANVSYIDAFEKALEQFIADKESVKGEKGLKSLKNAGIVTEDGKLTKRYERLERILVAG